MKQFINFIIWPALAGLILAAVMLSVPKLVPRIPALDAYLKQQPAQVPAPQPAILTFSTAIKKSLPAVVSINNLQLVNRKVRIITPYASRISNMPDSNNTLGSGVIINPDGYVITSYHVMFNSELEIVRPEQDITVTLNDGRNLEADLIALDAKNDLALLKIDADHLTHLKLADSSVLEAGDIVLAIGNPRNVGQSVSFGIISALWKRDDSYMIQTDAAINPGNSGGALIDSNGNLIGVNSTIVSESGGSEGISFAVPASKAIDLLALYLTNQKLQSGKSGYLGVNADGVLLAEGIKAFGQEVQGFRINSVTPGSAADMAGIRPDDIITAVNDTKLILRNDDDEEEAYRTIAAISNQPPGALIMLEVFRNKEFIKVPTILGIGEPKVYASELVPTSNIIGSSPLETPTTGITSVQPAPAQTESPETATASTSLNTEPEAGQKSANTAER